MTQRCCNFKILFS